jgi:hypothetical protein
MFNEIELDCELLINMSSCRYIEPTKVAFSHPTCKGTKDLKLSHLKDF